MCWHFSKVSGQTAWCGGKKGGKVILGPEVDGDALVILDTCGVTKALNSEQPGMGIVDFVSSRGSKY